MKAIDRVVERIDDFIINAKKYGYHPQYVEGLKEALDIIRDELE